MRKRRGKPAPLRRWPSIPLRRRSQCDELGPNVDREPGVHKATEEFVVLVCQNQIATYEAWYGTVVESGLAGVLIWQVGSSGPTPDDGFMVRRVCVTDVDVE